jgi:hypothetical protein
MSKSNQPDKTPHLKRDQSAGCLHLKSAIDIVTIIAVAAH